MTLPSRGASRPMRVVELSNHPAAMLRDAERQRLAAAQAATCRYEADLAEHRSAVADLSARRDRARARHRWWSWLGHVLRLWGMRRKAPTPPVVVAQVSARERAIAAGMDGERAAVAEFDRLLGDDWVLLQGYRNRRGEVDLLLLGPTGLMAVEVKHRRGTVHVDGDDWRLDRYDRHGNLVASEQMADRRGRSPSRQLHEPVDELERFLRSHGRRVTIRRAVLLTHPRAEIGTLTNPTVQVATSARSLARALKNSPVVFDARERARLRRLIVQDHSSHERS